MHLKLILGPSEFSEYLKSEARGFPITQIEDGVIGVQTNLRLDIFTWIHNKNRKQEGSGPKLRGPHD